MRHVASWCLFVSAVALPAQSPPRDNALPQQANSGMIRGLLVARGVYGSGVAVVSLIVGSTDISMPVQLRRGGRIIGRVITEGGPPPTAAIDIEARPVDPALARMPGPPSVARARAGDTFTLTGLIGTRELRIPSASHGWAVRALL